MFVVQDLWQEQLEHVPPQAPCCGSARLLEAKGYRLSPPVSQVQPRVLPNPSGLCI